MKYKIRNLFILTLAASYLTIHVPTISAKEAAAPAKHKRKEGAALTAAAVVADMQKSVAFISKSAKGKIDQKSKEAIPFWAALKDCNAALDQLESGVKAKDESMLKGLDALGLALPQLSASWGIIRGSHEGLQVGRGVIALSKGYDTYLFHFGPAVARNKKGGEVTDDEKALLKKSQAEVAKLKSQLAALKAKPKSYEARMVADLLLLCKEIDKISGDDLKSYTKFCYQFDRLSNTCSAYGELVEVWYPDSYKSWETVSSGCRNVAKEYETVEWAYYESWDYTTVSVSHYADYYEATAAVSTITSEEETTYESYVEEYSEEAATEESEDESSEIEEEVSMEEDEDNTLAAEVEDGIDDEDGDGISDEDDTDNDNDGVGNEEDMDDDGDGVEDSADEDESGGEEEMADDDGDSDDDGMADDDGGGEEDGGDE